MRSIFRLFVFGFVLSCALCLFNVRERNTKKRNMCCTVVCYRMVWPRYLAWCDQYRGMIGGCNLVYNWPGTCPRPGLGHDISFIICIRIPGDICVNTCSYFYQIHNWPGNRRQQLKYNRSIMEMNTQVHLQFVTIKTSFTSLKQAIKASMIKFSQLDNSTVCDFIKN